MAAIKCPHCGTAGKAPDQVIGQQVRCPKCKQSFIAGGEPPPVEESNPFATDDAPAPAAEESADEGFPDGNDPPPDDDEPEDDDAPPARKPQRSRSGGGAGGGAFLDVLLFRKMLTPSILIHIFFWMMILACVGYSGLMIVAGVNAPFGGSVLVVIGLVVLLLGPVTIRIFCEVAVAIIRIQGSLAEIEAEKKKKPS